MERICCSWEFGLVVALTNISFAWGFGVYLSDYECLFSNPTFTITVLMKALLDLVRFFKSSVGFGISIFFSFFCVTC